MATEGSPSSNAPQITNVTSASISSSHNVAVITHHRFLIAVPAQFQCQPLARANELAIRFLETTSPVQMKAIAEAPTATGDLLFLIFSVLVIMGFIACCIVLALQRKYSALFWIQPLLAFLVHFLKWSAQKLWKPQHIVLSKETGMLHSRRNSFVKPFSIPISSIRFFRKAASFNPRFTRSRIRYGIEAVTTGTNFSFAFGDSEDVAAQLEEMLNRYLRSFPCMTPSPTIIGNVGCSAAAIDLYEHDITDVHDLPHGAGFSFQERGRYLIFTMSRKWIPEAMYITAGLFAVWFIVFSLSVSAGDGPVRNVVVNPYAIIGTVLYLVILVIILLFYVMKKTWKLCNGPDNRNFVLRIINPEKVLNVSDYICIKLERCEAKMLLYYVEKNKRGKERLSGKRYKLVLKPRHEDTVRKDVCLLGKLSEGEAIFVIGKMGKAFPFLFPTDRCEV